MNSLDNQIWSVKVYDIAGNKIVEHLLPYPEIKKIMDGGTTPNGHTLKTNKIDFRFYGYAE